MSNENNNPEQGQMIDVTEIYKEVFQLLLDRNLLVRDGVIALSHVLLNIGNTELAKGSEFFVKTPDGSPCLSIISESDEVKIEITCGDNLSAKRDNPLKQVYNSGTTETVH